MTRKFWILLVLAIVLAGVSLYLHKDWFAKDTIQIYDRSRPLGGARFRQRTPDQSPITPIVFGFGSRLRLKSLQVFPLRAIETNKFPQPIWHLVSESNSVALKAFTYGQRIAGMHPAVKGAVPAPLQPGEKYRLVIQAGSQKAEHDFVPLPAVP